MRKYLSVAALAMALAAPGLSNAAAVETAVYLHCSGDTGVAQVDWAAAGTTGDRHATFDTTAPSDPGKLCATPDAWPSGTANHNPIYDFPIYGEYEGAINNLTITLYAAELSGSRALNEWTVDLHLQIDGVDVLKRPTVADNPISGAATSVARKFEVTVTGINVPDGYHEVRLTAHIKYVDGSGVLAWLYDNPSYPSGLTFNDSTLASFTIGRNA